jgi:hypothetical protein
MIARTQSGRKVGGAEPATPDGGAAERSSARARPATVSGWAISYPEQGPIRCRHPNGSIIYIAGSATEAEVAARLTEMNALIARLERRRWTP